MNNLVFNSEGPMMNGTWINPQTGDTFTVKDSFFQDNQYVVQTTDGRLLDYNMIQNYIQAKNSEDLNVIKQATHKREKQDNYIPKEVLDIMESESKPNKSDVYDHDVIINCDYDVLPDDAAMISGVHRTTADPITAESTPVVDPDNLIIEKALKKSSLPEVSFNIEWLQYPEKEISMLIDIMDIDLNKVIDYYIQKIDVETIRQNLVDSFAKMFNEFGELTTNIDVVEYVNNESTKANIEESQITKSDEIKNVIEDKKLRVVKKPTRPRKTAQK